ncbi:MAG: alpha/beta fold hydrolase [Pseudomonadales bacterium]
MKAAGWLLVALLAVALIPVGIRQLLGGPPERALQAPHLDDLSYTEVRFADGEIPLAGLLFRPDGNPPFPGIVIIHGSGTSRRDNGWYLSLVAYLQASGIAVLLPDKRGSERSGGDWHRASFEMLAGDAEAALAYLAGRSDLSVDCLGVIGLSQGGTIAPMVRLGDSTPAFLVNVVGSAVSMHAQLYYEEVHNLEELGFLPGISDAVALVSAWSIRAVRQAEFWNAVGDFDPLPYWRAVTVPSLMLYGDRDTNVPTRASVARLETIANPMITVNVYPESGHALESPPGAGTDLFRKDALADIVRFIRGRECVRPRTAAASWSPARS